nr:nose resistant to fluoxetine protein 6-like [Rhipicephalus microplus]
MPNSLVSKLLAAEVRPECNKALLRTVRALQSLEPWVLRLIDATGKYPTGFLEASHVDMGAFDQCLETFVRDRSGTVVSRGQYCNLHVYAKSSAALQAMMDYMSDAMHPSLVYFTKHGSSAEDPLARLALCYIDECNQRDLQALVNAVSVPFFRFEVSNCVTAEPRPWNNTQIAIAIFAGVLLLVIIVSTLADHFAQQQSEWRKNHGLAFQVVQAFSAKSNTELLLYVPSKEQAEQHSLLFLHGIRCLATVHIVAGHLNVMITDSLTRVLSLFAGSTKWQNMLIPAAFNSVDTFFFLSGFFLCHIICKQKANSAAVFIIAVIKRLIRMCVPLFFVIMWFYLLPRFVDGPDTEAFFQRFNGELSKHWWMFLVQIRNFYEFDLQDILVYPWYLSADFQLFLVSLLTLLTFRR